MSEIERLPFVWKWEPLLYGRGKAGSQGGGLAPEKTPLKVSFYPTEVQCDVISWEWGYFGYEGERSRSRTLSQSEPCWFSKHLQFKSCWFSKPDMMGIHLQCGTLGQGVPRGCTGPTPPGGPCCAQDAPPSCGSPCQGFGPHAAHISAPPTLLSVAFSSY